MPIKKLDQYIAFPIRDTMHIQQLAQSLRSLCDKQDVSSGNFGELEERFSSLRAYGRLPKGRSNRGRALTDKQIAYAVLALVPTKAGWAGHATTVLESLTITGGEVYGAATTLAQAIASILSESELRKNVVTLRISSAEFGTNSSGYAHLIHETESGRQTIFFVPRMATSLLQKGTKSQIDESARYSAVSREIVFNRKFFDQLSRQIEHARNYPREPEGDGSEFDAEEALAELHVRLEVRPTSRFLHVGVDNQVCWPSEGTLVHFDDFKLVLLPKTHENVQSIHVDLEANGLTVDAARTVINRFLSVLVWCEDGFAIAQDGWVGNPVPVPVARRNLAFITTRNWTFDRKIPSSDEARRALGLYREARNAELNFLTSYAVLNYFKTIEIRHPEGKDARKWIALNFPIIHDEILPHDLERFLTACGAESPEEYIWKACRLAVAHSSHTTASDPDDSSELSRLGNAASVLKSLARHFIKNELGVSTKFWSED